MSSFLNFGVSVGKLINTISNIAGLRSYQPRDLKDGDTVIVSSANTVGDFGGGIYVWSSKNNIADDGVNYIKPVFAFTVGRWVRNFTVNTAVLAPINSTPSTALRYPINIATAIGASNHILNFVPSNLHANIIAGTNTTDLAPYITTALAQGPSVDFGGLPILVKSPITVIARRYINFNGSILTAQLQNNNDPIFTTAVDTNGDQYSFDLRIDGGRINGPYTVFRARLAAYQTSTGATAGLSLKATRMHFDGQTRAKGTRVLDARCVDFVAMRDCLIWNYDKAFHFEAISNVTLTASTTAGSTTLTLNTLQANEKLTTGMFVTGAGISTATSVTRVSDNQYTLSQAATATGTGVSMIAYADRDNTQNVLETVYVYNCNQVGFISDSDKCFFTNVDAMNCGGGWYIGKDNIHIKMLHCHVEQVGFDSSWKNDTDIAANTAKFGWCWYVQDNVANNRIVLDQCDGFVNTTTASIGGLYRGRQVGVISDVQCRNCFFELPRTQNPAWIPMEIHGQFNWYGRWHYTQQGNLILGDLNDGFTDIIIDEGTTQTKGNGAKSLLPGDKAINLRSTTGVAATITEDTTQKFINNGHLITWSNVGELYETLNLAQGWHTMYISGIRQSGVVFASVRDDAGNNLVRTQVDFQTNYERPMRIPFFVAIAGNYKAGIRTPSGAGAFIMGSIAVTRGFYSLPMTPRRQWDVPPTLSLPTASATYEGQMINVTAANSDTLTYICLRSSSNTFAWKKITLT